MMDDTNFRTTLKSAMKLNTRSREVPASGSAGDLLGYLFGILILVPGENITAKIGKLLASINSYWPCSILAKFLIY